MYITLLFLKYSVKFIIIYSMQWQMRIVILVRKLKYYNTLFAAARVV